MFHELIPFRLGYPRGFQGELDIPPDRSPWEEAIILKYISNAGELIGYHLAIVINQVSIESYSSPCGNE